MNRDEGIDDNERLRNIKERVFTMGVFIDTEIIGNVG